MPTMAYVVPRPNGSWELRESRSTRRGPRSRTLATFRALDAESIATAIERSGGPLTEATVRAAARRAGAPIAPAPADGAAASLLHELARGNAPAAGLRRALAAALAGQPPAGAEWIGTSVERRGRALWDLLLLADSIPPRRRAPAGRFPRLTSRAP